MIIHIRIPHFWIAVEEQRQPELRERAVIIGDGFLEKGSGHVRVLMANNHAQEFGVSEGMTLAHARQLCSEAVILSPELPIYEGVWDEVMALLLTYTPLVETIDPGEAVCDVSGSERLFGHPVTVAEEITRQIGSSARLQAIAGVGTNRLVAKLAAETIGEEVSTRNQKRETRNSTPVAFVQPGQEESFLAPFPITALPDIEPKVLLAFQVLGLKKIEHLTRISEKALESRFGLLGRRLAREARGHDDRPVRPAPQAPTLSISRRCDDDIVDGLEPDKALGQLITLLAADLSDALREKHLAGRLVTLTVKKPRSKVPKASLRSEIPKSVSLHRASADDMSSPPRQIFPNQDSRIHSMLPQPLQPGKDRLRVPTVKTQINDLRNPKAGDRVTDVASEIRTLARMATSHPVDDQRTLCELGHRLLLKILSNFTAAEIAQPGAELHLEMRYFAPLEQLTLPGLDGRPLDSRLARLNRGESILSSRFGSTPFRHLAGVNLDSVLPEKIFSWGNGIGRGGS